MSVQSIERAFTILRALALGPVGVTELAERVELPKSTVARILGALEAEGVVSQDEAGGEYRLGEGLLDIAGATQPGRNLVATARPHLIELTEHVGETSGISVPDGRDMYYLDHVEAESEVQVRSWTGETSPIHAVPSRQLPREDRDVRRQRPGRGGDRRLEDDRLLAQEGRRGDESGLAALEVDDLEPLLDARCLQRSAEQVARCPAPVGRAFGVREDEAQETLR